MALHQLRRKSDMSARILLASEVIFRRTFAIDYRDGETYHDISGRASRRILEQSDKWFFERNAQGVSQFTESEKNLTFLFGVNRLTLDQTLNLDVEQLLSGSEFGALAEVTSKIVLEVLRIQDISRIGYQVTCLYPQDSSIETHRALMNLAICAVPEGFSRDVGNVFEANRVLSVERKDHLLKILLNSFEQGVKVPQMLLRAAAVESHKLNLNQKAALFDKLKARKMIQRRPKFGIQMDLDAHLIDPNELRISDFVSTADQDMLKIKPLILS